MIDRHDPRLDVLASFGLGHVRPASGTWGSMPPVVLAGILIALGLGPDQQPWVYNAVLVAIVILFTAACVLWGEVAEARWGKDPSAVVADETAGQSIALLALPVAGFGWRTIAMLGAAYLLFRFMDIVKPPPSNGLQRLPTGWGIVLDDLVAGVYALVVVQAIGLLS